MSKRLRILAVIATSLVFSGVSLAQQPVPGGPVCGNGVAEEGEECDPGLPGTGINPDLAGKTCDSEGFGFGDLRCTDTCTLDNDECICAGLPATGQRSCWDSAGVEIACAGTGQDGEFRAGAPLACRRNPDGTIFDSSTGLMWERKNHFSGDIHDKDDEYLWEEAFTVFLATLNNTCNGDGAYECESDEACGTDGRCGYAGYRDWRLPNIRELLSLLDYGETSDPMVNWRCFSEVHCLFRRPCTNCSCTARTGAYWTSTSQEGLRTDWAWTVHFGSIWPTIQTEPKRFRTRYVRAVRGGL